MKRIFKTYETIEFDSDKELADSDIALLKEAQKSLLGAYAPYSKFKVGAAVLLSNGKVIHGSNQENAAYPSGLCAERVALFAAHAMYPKAKVEALAVVVKPSGSKACGPASPCGSCRQVIAEYEHLGRKKIRILLKGTMKKVLLIEGVDVLLPLAFTKDSL